MTRALLCLALVACSSPQQVTMTNDNTAPTWFRGVWKREWMREGKNPPTETRIVRDVQTPSVFGSVRIPLARPAITATSFDELDDAQLRALLEQKGFAGVATFEDRVALWEHQIDFQPPDTPDTARLTQQSPTAVLEEGLDGNFAELWWNLAPNDGRYLGVRFTRAGRVERILSVVGDHFVYARNRARDLPRAESLAALATNATRAELVELLDCEFSYGFVHGGRVPWEIRHSTLPWREGQSLVIAIDSPDATVVVNTFAPEDLRVMFSAAR